MKRLLLFLSLVLFGGSVSAQDVVIKDQNWRWIQDSTVIFPTSGVSFVGGPEFIVRDGKLNYVNTDGSTPITGVFVVSNQTRFGLDSKIDAGAVGAAVGGGSNNWVRDPYAYVAGGKDNTASHPYAVVSGGEGNTASGSGSVVAGGSNNAASGSYSAIGGGRGTTATGHGSFAAGIGNRADGASAAAVGGIDGSAAGNYSFVAGGDLNYANGDYSFAGGRSAKATTTASFVWADGSGTVGTNFFSNVADSFNIRAHGGLRLVGPLLLNELWAVGDLHPADTNASTGNAFSIRGGAGAQYGGPLNLCGGWGNLGDSNGPVCINDLVVLSVPGYGAILTTTNRTLAVVGRSGTTGHDAVLEGGRMTGSPAAGEKAGDALLRAGQATADLDPVGNGRVLAYLATESAETTGTFFAVRDGASNDVFMVYPDRILAKQNLDMGGNFITAAGFAGDGDAITNTWHYASYSLVPVLDQDGYMQSPSTNLMGVGYSGNAAALYFGSLNHAYSTAELLRVTWDASNQTNCILVSVSYAPVWTSEWSTARWNTYALGNIPWPRTNVLSVSLIVVSATDYIMMYSPVRVDYRFKP